MNKQSVKQTFRKWVKLFASVKAAVVIIVALAILIAVGTIVESQYNAEIAGKLVYKTPWMFTIMGALAITLIAVMIDRWPWKIRHAPFLFAHVGILVLLAGSLISMIYGIDGSMRVGIGEKARLVSIPETELLIYASFDGANYSKVFEKSLDFFKRPPTAENPVKVSLFEDDIQITDYKPFVIAKKVIRETTRPQAGSAVRFQLSGTPPGAPRPINMNEWIFQNRQGKEVSVEFGPARVVMSPENRGYSGNMIWLQTFKDNTNLKYHVFNAKNPHKIISGDLSEGTVVQTGWMNFEFKLLRFIPKAQEVWDLKDLKRPTEVSSEAVLIEFRGEKYWTPMNDMLKLFTDNSVYLISYSKRRIDLGFDIILNQFRVGRYPGTMRASSYESEVQTSDGQSALISMNEPMEHKGLLFYQASFQEDEQGKPTASIFSVNYDPGRVLKYLGSLILSMGIVWLFVNRARMRRQATAQQGSSVNNEK